MEEKKLQELSNKIGDLLSYLDKNLQIITNEELHKLFLSLKKDKRFPTAGKNGVEGQLHASSIFLGAILDIGCRVETLLKQKRELESILLLQKQKQKQVSISENIH